MVKERKKIKSIIIVLICLAAVGASLVFGVNAYVKNSQKSDIITTEDASKLENVDCIIVLGCQVHDDGTPSDMLRDRLDRAIELYNSGAASKIIMSGDHGRENYDEVNTMKKYAVYAGIPEEDVFMDHAGFSTYETIYRARDIFCVKKAIIVTQDYHLYRSLYIADKLGVEAYGVGSDYHLYTGQFNREVREILARDKDFIKTIFKPEPTYLGEKIPVSGDGNLTND